MDNIRIAILDAYDRVCAFMDNSAPKALHYYSDELHYFREGSANTYSFKASAKHEDAGYLVEGNKLSFQYGGKDYYFNIVMIYKTEYIVEVTGYSTVFELLNEDAEEYKASRAMKFKEYLDVFNFEKTIELGINEVSDKAVTHEWTGTSTILARIFSLANVFDAEAEIVTVLNDDYSLKKLVLNIYREHDSDHQGVGRYRKDVVLRYGKSVKGIKKTAHIKDLYTAIYPVGKDGLTISGINKEEKDADGNMEYYSPAGDGVIRAVQARDRFPSNTKGSDRYILKRWSYDTDNVNVLYGQALTELKKNCVPQVAYEVDGYFDTGIGDTVVIADDEFNPPLYLEARVTEQVRSFTDPKRNETTFDNFRELKSEVDTSLLDKMNELIKENKVYACTITTDNGIVFKNGEGTTSLTANVRDAGADKTDQFEIRWKKDDVDRAVGKTVIVHARDIAKKAVYRFEALEGAIVRGSYEVTVSNVSDGADGKNGVDGKDGKDGAQGKDGVGVAGVDVQYYKSSSATVLSGGVWQTNAPAWENGKYIWTKTVITYTDGKTGETSAVCVTGSEGGEGADGRGVQSIVEQYYKSASATVLSGGTWSGTYPGWENGKYIWTRSVVTYTDGSSKMTDAVCVTGGKGDNGIGISSVANKYAVSASSTTVPASWQSTAPVMTAANKYLWNYEILTYTNGTTSETQKRVIGVYGDKGNTGGTGRGIKSIAEYYLASTAASGVTSSTAGWTTAQQTTTTSKKYLWNYEVVTYTDNTTYVSTPVIIGTHGATGPVGPAGPTGPKGTDGQMLYAASGTAAATAAKTATLVSGTIALKAGVTVAVRFTYANTAASPTLNINSTGAKAVYTQGVRYAYWSAGATVIFTYDGSYWRVASEPVFANTATIGNPGAGHFYIDSDSIDFYQGSNIYGALSRGSAGECVLSSTEGMFLKGDGVNIEAPFHSVYIDCHDSQTSNDAFNVNAAGADAKFTANDLKLVTGANTVSFKALGDAFTPVEHFSGGVLDAGKTYNYSKVITGKRIVFVKTGLTGFGNFTVWQAFPSANLGERIEFTDYESSTSWYSVGITFKASSLTINTSARGSNWAGTHLYVKVYSIGL
jgi:phage minor structural protein